MAETDFSSSSPLAGSFLTGLIYPCRRDALSRWPGPYLSVFAAATESLLCGCFILRSGLLCLWFLHQYDGAGYMYGNGKNMS